MCGLLGMVAAAKFVVGDQGWAFGEWAGRERGVGSREEALRRGLGPFAGLGSKS